MVAKTNKTLAKVLVVLLPSAALANSEFGALLAWFFCGSLCNETEKQKERADIQIKHISDARFTVVKGSEAGQT